MTGTPESGFSRVKRDSTGNLPSLPAVFPDMMAPVVRVARGGERELTMVRWGFPRRRLAMRRSPMCVILNRPIGAAGALVRAGRHSAALCLRGDWRLWTGDHADHFVLRPDGDVIRAGSFASVNELVRDIETYLAQRNANPKPYKWKAKGAEILSKIKHARAALDKAGAA